MEAPKAIRTHRSAPASNGQALAEFGLVAPMFFVALFSVIVLGLGIFYQSELTNAARQAARYAAIHSSTAQCPTTSWVAPQAPPLSYYACDPPTSWPGMTSAARNAVWGLDPNAVSIAACWSGYRVDPADPNEYDSPAVDPVSHTPNTHVQCTMGGQNPITSQDSLSCPAPTTAPGDDTASNQPGSDVTVYACYQWTPPMAGLLFIPSTVTLRAVVTEVVQRQQ